MKFLKFPFLATICAFMMSVAGDAHEHKLSVAAIFRDEAPYLHEWIEYHILQGSGHFYLYNNLSQDDYQKVLSPYIVKGQVELIDWPHDPKNWHEWDQLQIAAYNDALGRAKGKTDWLAIIDIDEFVVPVKDGSLLKLLSRYGKNPGIGGICLPWVFFGTSNVQQIPDNGLLIESLVLNGGPAAGGNKDAIWNQGAFKSIVRPDYVSVMPSPHYCLYAAGKEHVMTAFEEAQINHYWTRDERFFNDFKIPRRAKWDQDADSVRAWAAGMNNDTPFGKPILRFAPALRKRMGLSSGSW